MEERVRVGLVAKLEHANAATAAIAAHQLARLCAIPRRVVIAEIGSRATAGIERQAQFKAAALCKGDGAVHVRGGEHRLVWR